jgi:hypothetical protein
MERINQALFRALDEHDAARVAGGTAAPPHSTAALVDTFFIDGSVTYDVMYD